MKRYTRGDEREGFRVLVRRPQQTGRRPSAERVKASIYEECETNSKCLDEALEHMRGPGNQREGVEIHIQEFYDDDWNSVVAFAWDKGRRDWAKLRIMTTGSGSAAKVRVALVLPGEKDVLVTDCGQEVGEDYQHCGRVLAELRATVGARVPGAQLHVQVKHPAGAWTSHRYEEFRRGKWHMVSMPSELVYLRNRRAR